MRNRVVGESRYSGRQVEVWHSGDLGDERDLVFRLPRGLKRETIEKAFRLYGQQWIDWLARQGMRVNGSTIRCHGPYPCLELDDLDKDQYVITARVKREKPEIMTQEQAEVYINNQPMTGSVADILRAGHRAPGAIESNARAQKDAKRQTKRAQESWRQMDEERKR